MKDKMRCAKCGTSFKQMRSSQTLCEKCEKREREKRAAAKNAGVTQQRPTTAPQPVKITGPAATLLDPNAAPDPTKAPPEPVTFGMTAWREEQRQAQERRDREQREQRERERLEREQARAQQMRASAPPHGHNGGRAHPPHGAHGEHGAQAKPRPPKTERVAAPRPPKPPRAPRPAPPQFTLTDEMREKIEARYLELAQPVEFDGIRTQIAQEMEIPKSLVKRAVTDLRTRMLLPSWWELQSYTGPDADLERIRSAYIPLLPLPDVGVHKTLAEQLGMDPRTVYQGIRRIRAEMRLPQYNPPEMHEPTVMSAPAGGEQTPEAPASAQG